MDVIVIALRARPQILLFSSVFSPCSIFWAWYWYFLPTLFSSVLMLPPHFLPSIFPPKQGSPIFNVQFFPYGAWGCFFELRSTVLSLPILPLPRLFLITLGCCVLCIRRPIPGYFPPIRPVWRQLKAWLSSFLPPTSITTIVTVSAVNPLFFLFILPFLPVFPFQVGWSRCDNFAPSSLRSPFSSLPP